MLGNGGSRAGLNFYSFSYATLEGLTWQVAVICCGHWNVGGAVANHGTAAMITVSFSGSESSDQGIQVL